MPIVHIFNPKISVEQCNLAYPKTRNEWVGHFWYRQAEATIIPSGFYGSILPERWRTSAAAIGDIVLEVNTDFDTAVIDFTGLHSTVKLTQTTTRESGESRLVHTERRVSLPLQATYVPLVLNPHDGKVELEALILYASEQYTQQVVEGFLVKPPDN